MSTDLKETLMSIAVSALILIIIIGGCLVVANAAWEDGYKHGWCASKGGVYLTDWKCSVNGQVINVERED